MRQEAGMTFREAIAILTEDGATLLEALENLQYIIDNEGIEALTAEERDAFRAMIALPSYAEQFGE